MLPAFGRRDDSHYCTQEMTDPFYKCNYVHHVDCWVWTGSITSPPRYQADDYMGVCVCGGGGGGVGLSVLSRMFLEGVISQMFMKCETWLTSLDLQLWCWGGPARPTELKQVVHHVGCYFQRCGCDWRTVGAAHGGVCRVGFCPSYGLLLQVARNAVRLEMGQLACNQECEVNRLPCL
jgi:hypothetical protein